MYERNWFGMMMVESGDADAFIAGSYSDHCAAPDVAKEVIGIREGYSTFATMHILSTKLVVFFLSDTLIIDNLSR